MGENKILTWILGGIALCSAAVEIVLLCIHQGNIFAIGLPFFLCLTVFGLSMTIVCLVWLLGEKQVEKKVCPACGKDCETKYAFCPSCGAKF